MSGVSQPSYDALAALVVAQRGQIEVLTARIAELEAKLGSNSRNSSRPPSSDSPFVKPEPKSLRGKSGRRPGGQPGHEGRTLRQVADPDRVLVHRPGVCEGCGASLAGAGGGIEVRQVFDIPKIKVVVTEHRIVTARCGCGHDTRAQAPAQVNAPVSYGPNAAAFATYLYAGQFLSKERTAQALGELFATPVSPGTVTAMIRRAAAGVRGCGVLEVIREKLRGARVAHFDETGLRVAGKLAWVHSASNDRWSLITVHPKRGIEGMGHAGVLPCFTGVAVHDAWRAYDSFTGATHALCNAHVLRELAAAFDKAPPAEWHWARQAHDAIVALKKLVDQAKAEGRASLDPVLTARHTILIHSAAGIGANTPGQGYLAKRQRALARRLLNRKHDYQRFLDEGFAIPWDNNPAEREIRMIKLRQKISGCMRTLQGARDFTDIRSYTATAAKHGTSLIDALVTLAEGHPWLPPTS